MIEALPVAIIATDHSRQIVAANHAALKLFAYDKSALLEKKLEVLMPERFAVRHADYYRKFLGNPVTRPMGLGRELVALKSSGEEFPVEIGLTVLNTEPQLYLASVIDLTLRKEVEAMLRDRQHALESTLETTRRQLEEQIASGARLAERQRLGRELHDTISQSLYGIGLGLRTALAQTDQGKSPRDALCYCLGLIESAMIEMRALLFKLRPQSLEEVPLAEVLKRHAKAISARTKFEVIFEHSSSCEDDLDFDQKYTVYRIATEALHNCTKHALDAGKVCITLVSEPDTITLKVEDDGPGFSAATSSGHGIRTMKERAEAAGGTFRIASVASGGTLVEAIVPRRPPPVDSDNGSPKEYNHAY